MSIVLKNNASGTLSTAISAADTSIALTYSDGDNFPELGVGEYFYATIRATDDSYEIVKVTARSDDSITVVRAQEDTTAIAFAAGSSIELRVTAQSMLDAAATVLDTIVETELTWTEDQHFDAIVDIYNANKLRWYNSGNTHYFSAANVANVFTWTYDNTSFLTVSNAGVVSFVNGPKVGSSAIYYAGGTDVPVTDGGTGSSTASGARTNLGLVIGTDVQAYSAAIASIAGLSTSADKMLYTTASNVYAVTSLTSFMRSVLAAVNAAAARTLLALGTIATQAANAVSITGGTVEGITSLQGRPKISPETSGVLTSLSANSIVYMSGDCTINSGVFSQADQIMFVAGNSSRQVIQGSGVVLRYGGTTDTGTRSLTAHAVGFLNFDSSTEGTLVGAGVS